MVENPFITVVVPSYNVEKTLGQALDSLVSQSFSDWEAVCVDDASTDGTHAILERYAESDSRFRVLGHSENSGYGKSMNDGIAAADGEWIAILEPDDYLLPDFLGNLAPFAKGVPELDLVKSPYVREVREEGAVRGDDPKALWQCSYKGRVAPSSQPFTMKDFGAIHLLLHHPSIWSAIYRKGFLADNGISFVEYPGAGWADNEFFYKTMLKAEAMMYIDKAGYVYREETASEYRDLEMRAPEMFFERWGSMAAIVEEAGWKGTHVEQAHIARGFTYLAGLEPLYAGKAEYEQRKRGMFARMDAELVATCTEVPPALKGQFYEGIGISLDNADKSGYRRFLLDETFYSIKNNGFKYAWDSAKRIISRK